MKNYRLYKSPLKITISNITKSFYIGGILNPLRYTAVVRRTYKVNKNELTYEDKVYIV